MSSEQGGCWSSWCRNPEAQAARSARMPLSSDIRSSACRSPGRIIGCGAWIPNTRIARPFRRSTRPVPGKKDHGSTSNRLTSVHRIVRVAKGFDDPHRLGQRANARARHPTDQEIAHNHDEHERGRELAAIQPALRIEHARDQAHGDAGSREPQPAGPVGAPIDPSRSRGCHPLMLRPPAWRPEVQVASSRKIGQSASGGVDQDGHVALGELAVAHQLVDVAGLLVIVGVPERRLTFRSRTRSLNADRLLVVEQVGALVAASGRYQR